MSPSFGPASLRNLEGTMNRFFDLFLSGIDTKAKTNEGIVEMNQWFHFLTCDVHLTRRLGLICRSLDT